MDLKKYNKIYVSTHFSHEGSFNFWTCLPIMFGHTTFNKDTLFDFHFNGKLVKLNTGSEIEILGPHSVETLDIIRNSEDELVLFYWNNYTDTNWQSLLDFINKNDKVEILVFSYVSDPTLTGNSQHHPDNKTLDQFLGKKVRFVSAFPHANHPNYIYSLEAAFLWWAHPDIRFTEMCMLASEVVNHMYVPKRISGYFGKPKYDRLLFYRECKDSICDNFSIYCAFPNEPRFDGRNLGDTSDVLEIPKPTDYYEYITEKNHYSNLFFMKSDVLYTHILCGSNISVLFESNNCEGKKNIMERWCWSEKGLGHLLLGKPFLAIEAASYMTQKQMKLLHPKVENYYDNVIEILKFDKPQYEENLYKGIHNFIKEILAMPENEYRFFYEEWKQICQESKNKLKENLKNGLIQSVIDEKNSLYNS